MAKKAQKVQSVINHLTRKEIIKIISVPNIIFNFVVK